MIKVLSNSELKNKYQFKLYHPVAVFWGYDDKDNPEYYAGVISNLDSENIWVKMNFGSVEKISRADLNAVIPVKTAFTDSHAYTKQEVSKNRIVEVKQPEVDLEHTSGAKLFQWATTIKGNIGKQVVIVPVNESVFYKFIASKIKVSDYLEFKNVWGDQYASFERFNGKEGFWMFKDLKFKKFKNKLVPTGKWVKSVKSFDDKKVLAWGTTMITDDLFLDDSSKSVFPK